MVVEGIVGRAKDSVEILKQDANNLMTAIQNNNKELLDAAHKAFEKSSFNTNEELKSIIEFFNRKNGGGSSNFSGSGGSPNTSSSIFGELYNFIYNSITNYNSLIDSLNVIELGALTHIIVSFIILICFWNILVLYFADRLIIWFKIEEKYPKLAKWIKIRKKFQDFYIIINSIAIVLILFSVIYTNLFVIYHSH